MRRTLSTGFEPRKTSAQRRCSRYPATRFIAVTSMESLITAAVRFHLINRLFWGVNHVIWFTHYIFKRMTIAVNGHYRNKRPMKDGDSCWSVALDAPLTCPLNWLRACPESRSLQENDMICVIVQLKAIADAIANHPAANSRYTILLWSHANVNLTSRTCCMSSITYKIYTYIHTYMNVRLHNRPADSFCSVGSKHDEKIISL